MPAVAEYPRPASMIVCHRFDTDNAIEPQGLEGRSLHREAESAIKCWIEPRAQILIAKTDFCDSGHGRDDPDQSYVSVPPKRTFHVRTRYVFHGKGKPLPFRLDEE